MDDLLFGDVSPEKRVEMLEANCREQDYAPVTRPYSEQEMAEMKDDLSEVTIDAHDAAADLKVLAEPYNARMKAAKVVQKDLATKLKLKCSIQSETVYLFDDQEAGLMGIYDAAGELVSTRKLTPKERQTRILPITKLG